MIKLKQMASAVLLAASVAFSGAVSAAGPAIPAMPPLAAKSYILMDAATGQILVEHNANEPLPPASLTKLMTAYIATKEIRSGQIGEQDLVTVSEKAWRTGGSRMFIEVGKQVSVDDLLHGIIIQSGNDASVAMAEYIAGSEEAFADMMNQQAVNLQLHNSSFRNATGLPADGHYSSALDMARLARAIIDEDQEHYAIYAKKEFFWNDIRQQNRNLLLWRDSTVDGLKTGHTEEAGYCLVASAVRDNMRLISVIFGARDEASRAAETQKLLTYGFRFFESRTFYKKGAVLTSTRVWKGKQPQVDVGLASDLSLVVPRGKADKMTAEAVLDERIEAPVRAGQKLGSVEVRLDGELLHTADLVATGDVEQGSIFKRIWDSLRLFIFNLFN